MPISSTKKTNKERHWKHIRDVTGNISRTFDLDILERMVTILGRKFTIALSAKE